MGTNGGLQSRKMADAWIVPMCKDKGNIQDCGTYRRMKLMSHAIKIL